MPSIGVFTIASKNYLAYVRVLLRSVARIHPEYKLFLCLADRVDGYFNPDDEPYTIVPAAELGIANFEDFSFRYDIMEFNTAVKPFMFRWLFDNTALDAAIYLDPDIQVFSRLEAIESALSNGASVVLTPHITQPLEDGKKPDDHSMLQTGVFNLGFIAVARCGESLQFVDWWGRHLLSQCASDLRAHLFVDQKWCDLAPCLLENLKILRHPAYNVAYWNLAHRKVRKDARGQWVVNDSPLAFFHFSGITPLDERLVSKYQDRFSWDDIPEAQPLFSEYNRALHDHGWDTSHNWPYAFDTMADGSAIYRGLRLIYRAEHPTPIQVEPAAIRAHLESICNRPTPAVQSDRRIRITVLMYLIYCLRNDLQAAFPLNTPWGRKQYAFWFESGGPREYGLPARVSQQRLVRGQSAPAEERQTSLAYRAMMIALEPTAKTVARLLPTRVRAILRRIWATFRR